MGLGICGPSCTRRLRIPGSWCWGNSRIRKGNLPVGQRGVKSREPDWRQSLLHAASSLCPLQPGTVYPWQLAAQLRMGILLSALPQGGI